MRGRSSGKVKERILWGLFIIVVEFLVNYAAQVLPALPRFFLQPFFIIAGVIIITYIVFDAMRQEQEEKHAEKPQPLSPLPRPKRVQSGRLTPRQLVQPGHPSSEHPVLLCFLLDVSHSMREPILVHADEAIRRWADLHVVMEHFMDLLGAFVEDPATQRGLPFYSLVAYGFGFKEISQALGFSLEKRGPVRDLLAHPSLPALPSASDLYEQREAYREHLFSAREFTLDLFGSSPMRRALARMRDRIKEECGRRTFTHPILLTIVSDGVSGDGDPLDIVADLQNNLGVMTICCYLGKEDVLAPRRLYASEEASWPEGAKLLFRCASPLNQDSYLARAMFNYLARTGWQPREGERLLTQINQTEALDSFLKILLSGLSEEEKTE
ncbi:MAG TPA: hypothetical protein VKV37_03145 [Ktedonobacteraceae bacterium]|nr:hypothetical protein [Ktedonobacteraceae bacterium]